MKIFLLIIFAVNLSFPQTIQIGQTYNISNTMSATSDYQSVHSTLFESCAAWGDNGRIMFKKWQYFSGFSGSNVIVSTTENTCGWPVVKYGNMWDGSLIYLVYHTLATGGNYEIIFQKSTNGGSTWSAMRKISGPASAITPQMTVRGDSVFVVWEERPNNNYEIYSAYSYDGGATWSQPANVSNTPTTSRWVQVHKDDYALYCVWIEQPVYPNGDIYISKSFNKGLTWSQPVNITNQNAPILRVSLSPVYYMEDYAVDKHFYLLYDRQVTVNFNEIYSMLTEDGGTTFSQAQNWTNNSGNSTTPNLMAYWTWLNSGVTRFLYFTWSDNTHSAPAYDNLDTYFKYSIDNGVNWSQVYNLSNNSENSYRPRFGLFRPIPLSSPPGADFLTVVWYDYTTGNAEILGKEIEHYFGNLVPVELISFSASAQNGTVRLNWSTATETNNRGFEIERKPAEETDGWVNAGFVNGAGTTTSVRKYTFEDIPPKSGKYVYRLTQIDYDGTRRELATEEVDHNTKESFYLSQNYPNPARDKTVINYRVPGDKEGAGVPVSLKMYDQLGREVLTPVNAIQPEGSYSVTINTAGLADGIYSYRLQAGDFEAAGKMIILKSGK